MKLLIASKPRRLPEWELTGQVGQMLTPQRGFNVICKYWAADNGAFSGFDLPAYLRMLAKVVTVGGCQWVTVPDVVADAPATEQLFWRYRPLLTALELPAAFVLQDGCESIPWEHLDCLFVGGSTDFKLSTEAYSACTEAKARGKLVHVGRVNSFIRIRRFADVADSFDGLQFSAYSETYVPRYLGWMREEKKQLQLLPPLSA